MRGTVLPPEAQCLWPASVPCAASRTVERSDTGLWAQAKHDLIPVPPSLPLDKWLHLFESQFSRLRNGNGLCLHPTESG